MCFLFMKQGGYLYYDFNDDGDLDLWHHFLAHPWPKDKRGIDNILYRIGNNKAYDSIYPSLIDHSFVRFCSMG